MSLTVIARNRMGMRACMTKQSNFTVTVMDLDCLPAGFTLSLGPALRFAMTTLTVIARPGVGRGGCCRGDLLDSSMRIL